MDKPDFSCDKLTDMKTMANCQFTSELQDLPISKDHVLFEFA